MDRTYVRERRHDFVGGHCTAYLMQDPDGKLFIHTVTHIEGGTEFKTGSFEVHESVADTQLELTASQIPTLQ